MTKICFPVLIAMVLCLLCTPVASAQSTAADEVIELWPNDPPGWKAPDQPEQDTSGPDGRDVAGKSVIRLGNVSTPQLHLYRATGDDSGTVVLINPGGGYSILAWDLEGTEIAQWLQGLGITAAVVKYRVPTRGEETPWLAPVQDIQRAIALVRSGAIEGLEVKRVGVLGFSAGGNASARVALSDRLHYYPVDARDNGNLRPDFAVLIYPAWLVTDEQPDQLIDELQVSEKSPTMFLAHAGDDRISAMSSVTMFTSLRQHQVPASLHVFASGGHGFGGRIDNQPTDAWRDLCADWMKSQGWLKK